MSAIQALAVLCGLVLGVGLWSIVAVIPRLRRPRLADRLAPYVADVSDEARELLSRTTLHPLPALGSVFGPATARVRDGLLRALGGGESVRGRLRQAGIETTVEEFRLGQITWGVAGLAAGVAAVIGIAVLRPMPLVVAVALPPVGALVGYYARDALLTRRAGARLARMSAEFPTVLELITLSLSAGEGILDAIRRVSRAGSGELAAEFGRVVTDVGMGVPVADSLARLARDIRLPPLTRCVAAITTALDRGTPLAEVLRAQAADAREAAKRDLLEAVGKKEVAMLVPLVFLILPVTVLFAIYPGIFVL